MNRTPGFKEGYCEEHSPLGHSCDPDYEEHQENEMMKIINVNESKFEYYEKLRNEFVYKLLLQVEH